MANDKDITIGLKTTGDTSGAEKVVDAIHKIPEATAPIPPSVDEVSASFDDLTKRLSDMAAQAEKLREPKRLLDESTEAADKNAESIKNIEMATKAMLAGQMLEIYKKIGGALREATKEGTALNKEIGDMGPALDAVDTSLDMVSAGFGTAVATGNPLIGLLAGVAAGVGGVIDKYIAWQNQEAKAAAANQNALQEQERLLYAIDFRKRNIGLITQVDGIEAENQALDEQEERLKNLVALRDKLSGQANTSARLDVDLAKLKGGDVALAEARVIATELSGGLQKLNDDLALAKQEATEATRREISTNKAWVLAQKEVAQGIRRDFDDEVVQIEAAAKQAAIDGADAREKLTGFLAVNAGARNNLLKKAEVDLEKKEQEYGGKFSTAAKGVFDGIFKTIETEYSQKSQDAIAQITADAAKVTDAAASKAGEVSAAMSAASDGAVQSIQQIGAISQQSAAATNQAVSAAAGQINQALDLMSDRFITALATVAANGIANASKLAAQEARINQLFARSR